MFLTLQSLLMVIINGHILQSPVNLQTRLSYGLEEHNLVFNLFLDTKFNLIGSPKRFTSFLILLATCSEIKSQVNVTKCSCTARAGRAVDVGEIGGVSCCRGFWKPFFL